MIEESMRWLGTTKPLITFADYKLNMFKPIIKKYDWELAEIVFGLYNDKSEELCFNSKLTKNSSNNVRQQLYKRLVRCLKLRESDYH